MGTELNTTTRDLQVRRAMYSSKYKMILAWHQLNTFDPEWSLLVIFGYLGVWKILQCGRIEGARTWSQTSKTHIQALWPWIGSNLCVPVSVSVKGGQEQYLPHSILWNLKDLTLWNTPNVTEHIVNRHVYLTDVIVMVSGLMFTIRL